MLEKPELMKDFSHDEKGGFYQIYLLNISVSPQFHQSLPVTVIHVIKSHHISINNKICLKQNISLLKTIIAMGCSRDPWLSISDSAYITA